MKSLYNIGLRNEGSDSYYTPRWITDKFPDVFNHQPYVDPCPGNREQSPMVNVLPLTNLNGLETDWSSYSLLSFVNPPFSDISSWLEHASLQSDQGHTSLFFCKLDYRTKWFEIMSEVSEWIIPVTGYVKFEREDMSEHLSATFQMCFCQIGTKVDLKPRVISAYANRLYLK